MNDTPPSSAQSPAWRGDLLARRLPVLQARNRVTAALRAWFAGEGFTEVETPALQVSPGMEPHLNAFATRLRQPFEDGEGAPLFLHTSPEFAMKKLLAGGMDRIFQLARCWRNGERSDTHHPEFTMLEWYRAGANWRAGAADCEQLIRVAAASAGKPDGAAPILRHGEAICDPAAPWRYLSVADAFDEYCGIDLLVTLEEPLQPDRDLLARGAKNCDVRCAADDSWDVIFDRLLLEKIGPHLGLGSVTLLHDWPLMLGALARQSDHDPRLADRFEVYCCGIELANGFGELTDSGEQRRRFEADQAKRRAMGAEPHPIDEDFLAALENGFPESSGVALGFDRLVMLCTGAARIEDVLWLPVVTSR